MSGQRLDRAREKLRARYITRLPERIEAIEALLADDVTLEGEHLAELRNHAHQLCGSGASYGFPEVSESASRFLGEPSPENARALVDTLRALVESAP